MRATTTSPRNPWAFVIRPTSSISAALLHEVDVDRCAVAHGGGAHDRADRLRDAAALADDAAHVAGRHPHLDGRPARSLADVDLDAVGLLDDRLHEVFA